MGAGGETVRLAGVNWYGFECDSMVAGGLDLKTVGDICQLIVDLGFNHIRLPYCDQMLFDNPLITKGLAANPVLQGRTAVEVMDELIAEAGRHGLRVVLDNHRSEAGWSAQENGLWYSRRFTENDWLESLRFMANRYKDNQTVIGIDLRNEPGSPAIEPDQFPKNGGAVWGEPDRLGTRWPRDWAAAAERGGNEVLKVNPNLLIFVEGVRGDPGGPIFDGQCHSYWPGGNLCGVRSKGGRRRAARPIKLRIPERLVYSVHDYGPDMHSEMPWCQADSTAETAAASRSVCEQTWGFIARHGIAPVYVGEFGTPNGFTPGDNSAPSLVTDTDRSSTQAKWFNYLVDYMSDLEVSWAYWCLNGDQPLSAGRQAGQPELYGILKSDWSGPASASLMTKLAQL